MKEIRKIEKKKRSKEEKNMKMDPGKRFGPEQKRAHGPPRVKTRIGTLSPFSR
jgi:hypothetical protein